MDIRRLPGHGMKQPVLILLSTHRFNFDRRGIGRQSGEPAICRISAQTDRDSGSPVPASPDSKFARVSQAASGNVDSRQAYGSRVFAAPFCHTALTSSVRHMGPPSEDGPSAFRKVGQLPPSIHTRVSGGCFPTNGANTPRAPPISTLTTYRVASRLVLPVENESAPSA